MNYDIYFNFFYKLINQNLLIERTSIYPILKDKVVRSNDLFKDIKKLEKFVVEVELESKKFLLIKDWPINFLISHSIVIGESTVLYEFMIDDKCYIAHEELLYLFDDNKIKNKKKVDVKQFYNLKYEFNFKLPQIIVDLKKYLSKYKNLDFNKIHIVKSLNVENFNPTSKPSHFKLAKSMNLPVISLIKNNFLINSNINVYDIETQKNIIKPLFVVNENSNVKVCKKNNLILYNDILMDYYVKVSSKDIIDKINQTKKLNFDYEQVVNQIINIKTIKLSSKYGKYFLPLFKSVQNQTYLKIENVVEFESLSGMKFKNTTLNFNELYFQSSSGERLFFKNKYLDKDIENILKDIKETDYVKFENVKELILKIIFNYDNSIKSYTYIIEELSNSFDLILKNMNYILEKIIYESIYKNQIPKEEKSEGILDIFLDSMDSYISKIIKEYQMNYYSNIIDLYKMFYSLKILINKFNLESRNFYQLLKIIDNIIKVFDLFGVEDKYEIKKKLNDYFKDVNLTHLLDNKIDYDIINLMYDVLQVNNMKRKVSVYIKDDCLDESFFKNIEVLNKLPKYEKYVKLDKYKVKCTFKYNYKKIIEEYEKNKDYGIDMKVNLKDRVIKLDKNYFVFFYKYEGYKTVIDNRYFIVLKKE